MYLDILNVFLLDVVAAVLGGHPAAAAKNEEKLMENEAASEVNCSLKLPRCSQSAHTNTPRAIRAGQ